MHFLINTTPMDAPAHMAFDELAARAACAADIYLRFYNWAPGAAVTFGYAQAFPGGAAVRRPTGGGVVEHKDDVTFSIIFPASNLKLQDIYSKLHAVINTELGGEYGVYAGASDYSPGTAAGAPNACFKNPVQSDLMAGAQKVLGGALRKFEKNYLYQGSFQSARAREDAKLKAKITSAISIFFGVRFKEMSPAPAFMRAVQKEALKYKSKEWNEKFR